MTEPQWKDLEGLLEQLRQEEEICFGCRDRGVGEVCECCSVHGNIRDLEMQWRDMFE